MNNNMNENNGMHLPTIPNIGDNRTKTTNMNIPRFGMNNNCCVNGNNYVPFLDLIDSVLVDRDAGKRKELFSEEIPGFGELIDNIICFITRKWYIITGDYTIPIEVVPCCLYHNDPRDCGNRIFFIKELDNCSRVNECVINIPAPMTVNIDCDQLSIFVHCLLNKRYYGRIGDDPTNIMRDVLKYVSLDMKYIYNRHVFLTSYLRYLRSLDVHEVSDKIKLLNESDCGKIYTAYNEFMMITKDMLELCKRDKRYRDDCVNKLVISYVDRIFKNFTVNAIASICNFTNDEFVEYLLFINDSPSMEVMVSIDDDLDCGFIYEQWLRALANSAIIIKPRTQIIN